MHSNVAQTIPAVRARAWYRQFREITLAAAVYNVEQVVKR